MRYKSLFLFITVVLTYVVLKFLFKGVGTDEILFLLKPVNNIFEMLTGSPSIYLKGEGYFHPQLDIIINKSCAGYNFWLLCFMMLTFLLLQKVKRSQIFVVSIPLLLIFSYLITIVVNVSRMVFIIKFKGIAQKIEIIEGDLLHEMQGAFVYLFFLVVIYLSADAIIQNFNNRYEKSIES